MKTEQRDTAQRVLEAATQIFADVGYAGARVDEIAKTAGMNKTAIYYHIGGKEKLYAAVLQNLLGDLVDQTLQKIQEVDSPEEKLKAYIHSLTLLIGRNPYLAQIMLREAASGIRYASEIVTDIFMRLIGILAEILDAGQKQNDFTDVEAAILHVMIVGAIALLKAKTSFMTDYHKKAIPSIFTLDLEDDNLFQSVALEIETLIVRAVKTERGGSESIVEAEL